MSRWPDFFIVGAPKAGTTAMYELLRRSNGICMSSVKEPRFFNTAIDHSVFMSGSVTDEAAYLELFRDCDPSAILGEASPSYLIDPYAPSRIFERSPHAKIIVMVRDPVARAYSHYRFHETRTGRASRTFDEAITACEMELDREFYHPNSVLQTGLYSRQIRRFQDTFGPAQVKVVVYDDFIGNPARVAGEVCDFAGAPQPSVISLDDGQRNAAAVPRNACAAAIMSNRFARSIVRRAGLGAVAVRFATRHLVKAQESPAMLASSRKRLEAIYCEDTAQLELLLGRSVPWTSDAQPGDCSAA